MKKPSGKRRTARPPVPTKRRVAAGKPVEGVADAVLRTWGLHSLAWVQFRRYRL